MTFPLHHILKAVWDICFPPSENERLVRGLSSIQVRELFALTYKEGVWSLSSFKNPSLRALLHEVKFHSNKGAQTLLAEFLIQLLNEKKSLASHLWLPIPLSKTRFRERGYNQVTEILKALPKDLELHISTNCLVRTRNTKPQTELERAERLKNVIGAFHIAKPEQVTGKDIVILDDVTTTGATLRAAAAALLPYNPKSVTLIALSH